MLGVPVCRCLGHGAATVAPSHGVASQGHADGAAHMSPSGAEDGCVHYVRDAVDAHPPDSLATMPIFPTASCLWAASAPERPRVRPPLAL